MLLHETCCPHVKRTQSASGFLLQDILILSEEIFNTGLKFAERLPEEGGETERKLNEIRLSV